MIGNEGSNNAGKQQSIENPLVESAAMHKSQISPAKELSLTENMKVKNGKPPAHPTPNSRCGRGTDLRVCNTLIFNLGTQINLISFVIGLIRF